MATKSSVNLVAPPRTTAWKRLSARLIFSHVSSVSASCRMACRASASWRRSPADAICSRGKGDVERTRRATGCEGVQTDRDLVWLGPRHPCHLYRLSSCPGARVYGVWDERSSRNESASDCACFSRKSSCRSQRALYAALYRPTRSYALEWTCTQAGLTFVVLWNRSSDATLIPSPLCLRNTRWRRPPRARY